MRDWVDVAVLAKTRNLDGRLVVRSAAGLPFLLGEGDEVAFVPPQTDMPRRAVVEELRQLDERTAEARFSGVGRAQASGLVGCHCLMKRAAIDEELFEDEPALWEGWRVVDAASGLVGEVAGVVERPAQALLEVERADGGGLALVPVVDEIVREIDIDAKTIRVDLPCGLLDV